MNAIDEKQHVFMAIVGFAVSIVGALFVWDYISFISGTAAVDGVVISIESELGNKNKTVYAPIVRYNVNGVEYTTTRKDFTNLSVRRVGDVAQVVYKIERPSISRVYDWSTFYMPLIISLGGPLLLIGSFFKRRSQREKSLKM